MQILNKFKRELLEISPSEDDFIWKIDTLIDAVPEEHHKALIPSIFLYFEKNFLDDCGAPGTLVHLIESFYPSFTNVLLKSIKKAPSYNAILMINRILNSELSTNENKKYTSILKIISNDENIHKQLRKEAVEFLEYQSNKNS